MLEAQYEHMFWTPCAAHCLDLMLEDIGRLPGILTTIKKSIALSGYIYNHIKALNLMRCFTNAELLRPAKTRFATSFLTLDSIHKQKNNLRKMVLSNEWKTYKEELPKGESKKAKVVEQYIISAQYWNGVVYALKATRALVKVLRLADSEKKPAMGYIYEAMDMAKERIKEEFDGNHNKYDIIYEIIDKRWESQLHKPLHAAGFFLNPAFYYRDPARYISLF